MSVFFWIFVGSFAVIILMTIYRYIELKIGKSIFSNNARYRSDVLIASVYFWVVDFIYKKVRMCMSAIKAVPHKISDYLHVLWCRIAKRVDNYFDKLRGKKELNKNGTISAYWQKMSKNESDPQTTDLNRKDDEKEN